MAKDMSRFVEITKEFDFDAAHRLPHVPEGHKCGRMHGHTYRVVLGFIGSIDPELGWFIDYADIAKEWEPLNAALDHRTLNDVPGLENPTTEVLAHWIADHMNGSALAKWFRWVKVYESSTTYVTVQSFQTPTGRPA